jgi:hypothetical protein
MATELAHPTGEDVNNYDWIGGTFLAWGKLPKSFGIYDMYGSYGINEWIRKIPYHFPKAGVALNFWENTDVKRPRNIPIWLDSTYMYSRFYGYGPPRNEEYKWRGASFVINRHDGYINGLFMDLSGRKIGLKELWTLKWHRNFNTANYWTRAGGIKPEDWPEWMRKFKDY